MTKQKTFKSRVRARMDKTGESYTAARRRLVDKVAPEPAAAPPADPVRAQQPSAEAVRERTGRTWDEWFALLDGWQAAAHSHGEIARWLITDHQVDGWWAQSITVGYEQARGLRAPGQGRDGFFSVGGTRTVDVPVERLFQAFADESVRRQWLDADIRVRTATAPKSFRADWTDRTTRVVVVFTPKGQAKAHVAVSHEKVADAGTAAQLKAYWRDRLADLKRLLEQ